MHLPMLVVFVEPTEVVPSQGALHLQGVVYASAGLGTDHQGPASLHVHALCSFHADRQGKGQAQETGRLGIRHEGMQG
jgi:hypothetical protein